ncbi:hypothetical protein FRB95_006878 [Tulasnella sp. JGI-2019a]|nr:hypothetical protein FRB95_006878 [Tulasnella sp. JGI-2019a]
MQAVIQKSTVADGVVIEVSTTFFPAAIQPGTNGRAPDTILFSSDAVFFYCHRSSVLSRSTNSFGNLISSAQELTNSSELSSNSSSGGTRSNLPTFALSEVSSVINLMLHIVYGLSSQRFAPDLDTIELSLRALEKYGIPAPDEAAEIWTVLLHHAQTQPLRAYAIAAGHAMEAICVRISPYTLKHSLTGVTEGDALTMGPLYLRRLFFLHLGRKDALKRVIEKPPAAHRPLSTCSPEDAMQIVQAWEVAVANIVVLPMPQCVSEDELRNIFATVVRRRRMCLECLASVRARVSTVIADWEAIKKTI